MRQILKWFAIAALGGTLVATLVGWWFNVALTRVLLLIGVMGLVALSVFSLWLLSLQANLQRLQTLLEKGETISQLTWQELGELGQALASIWQQAQEATERLREERALLQAVLQRMTEAVMVIDEQGTLILANPSAETQFHLPSNYHRRRLSELELPFAILELVQRTLRSKTPQVDEVQILYPEEQILDTYALPLSVGGKTVGVLLVARDLTELKRLEKLRRDFVANVSHELRTPIATMRSLAEALLMGGKDDPEVRDKFLSSIAEEAERMGRLIDNLLELARIETGRREWRRKLVALEEIVQQVIDRLRPQADAKGLSLQWRIPDPLEVYTDPDALTQILFNLIDNAIKYTHQGYVVVEAEQVSAPDGQWVTIHVRDTGIGISPEHLSRIFERFYRVDKARSRQLGGYGLGLSIAKHLAEAQGGKITVQSQVGKGSTFTLWLPASSPATVRQV